MNFAHPWLGILKPEETKEETENLFIVPEVSPGQLGPEGEGVMDPQPNLSPDSVQFKDKSVKKSKSFSSKFRSIRMIYLIIVESSN